MADMNTTRYYTPGEVYAAVEGLDYFFGHQDNLHKLPDHVQADIITVVTGIEVPAEYEGMRV